MKKKTHYKFSEGLAPFKGKNEKFGYINYKGEVHIEAKYDVLGAFSDGLAAVGEFINEVIIKVSFINRDEKKLPFDFKIHGWGSEFDLGILPYFKNGFCKIAPLNNDRRTIYINKKGAIPSHLKEFEPVTDFNDDKIAEVKNPNHILVTSSGQEIKILHNNKEVGIPNSSLLPFTDSLRDSVYSVNYRDPYFKFWYNYYYEYNQDNQTIKNLNRRAFRYASRFDHGVACIKKTKNSSFALYNKKFRKYISWPPNYGYSFYDYDQLDYIGEFLIPVGGQGGGNLYNFRNDSLIFHNDFPENYRIAGSSNDGMVRYINRETGKWGYFNCSNGTIINPIYSYADDFNEGFAKVLVNGKHEYINVLGNPIITF